MVALLEAQGALKPVRAGLEIAAGIPHMLGRAHLLEQTIVNLVLNAVDAAGGAGGAGAWLAPLASGVPNAQSFVYGMELVSRFFCKNYLTFSGRMLS